MSRLRKTGLTIDDPLASAEQIVPTTQTAATVRKRTNAPDAPSPRPRPSRTERRPATERADAWRPWSGQTRVASYRLPDELLAELASRSAHLQVQFGLLVTAAITHLLDQPDDVICELVDRADDARIHGRRAARRQPATTPPSRSPSEEAATL
jgi:hypothetical protein